MLADAVRLAGTPADIHFEISPLDPAELLEALLEHGQARLSVRVVCGHTHQYSNAPHRVGLLRAHHKRPCGGAAEQRDDLAALHDGHRLSSHTDARLYQSATAVAQSVCRISSLPMEGSARVVALARERADVRGGSFASLRRAARLRRMSAMPSMATESVRRNEPTRWARSDIARLV